MLSLLPAPPTISAMNGCTPVPSRISVKDCPTSGGSLIRLRGVNFGSDSALILIGSLICTNVVHDLNTPHRELTCLSPSGVGVDR